LRVQNVIELAQKYDLYMLLLGTRLMTAKAFFMLFEVLKKLSES
jgi:hypothetical protein